MREIQGKSILVRVSEGSSYRESTVFLVFYSIRVDPDWQSELIRSDFCTCLKQSAVILPVVFIQTAVS